MDSFCSLKTLAKQCLSKEQSYSLTVRDNEQKQVCSSLSRHQKITQSTLTTTQGKDPKDTNKTSLSLLVSLSECSDQPSFLLNQFSKANVSKESCQSCPHSPLPNDSSPTGVSSASVHSDFSCQNTPHNRSNPKNKSKRETKNHKKKTKNNHRTKKGSENKSDYCPEQSESAKHIIIIKDSNTSLGNTTQPRPHKRSRKGKKDKPTNISVENISQKLEMLSTHPPITQSIKPDEKSQCNPKTDDRNNPKSHKSHKSHKIHTCGHPPEKDKKETGKPDVGLQKKQKLYKTELCRNWEEIGQCRYEGKCQYAHGVNDLHTVERHPKYKTQICRTFHTTGTCPYGIRCTFRHHEASKPDKKAPVLCLAPVEKVIQQGLDDRLSVDLGSRSVSGSLDQLLVDDWSTDDNLKDKIRRDVNVSDAEEDIYTPTLSLSHPCNPNLIPNSNLETELEFEFKDCSLDFGIDFGYDCVRRMTVPEITCGDGCFLPRDAESLLPHELVTDLSYP